MVPDLAGILVVSLEQAIAAPFTTSRLVNAGARVIKVERDEGDFARRYDRQANGLSAYFVWLNYGKESVVLDIKDQGDRDLLREIISRADVFVQNLSPGAAARCGFGDEDLLREFPHLITCSISGYGETGPYRSMKAYDLLIQAETGLCSINGSPDEPARVGLSVCDIATGMNAYQAILEALLGRQKSGRGRNIRISMFDCVADWMNVPFLQYAYGGAAPARTGVHHPTITPYGAYRCRGGETIVVAIQNEEEWGRFCSQVLDRPDLEADQRFRDIPGRASHRAILDGIINDVLSRRDRSTVIDTLEAAKIAYGRLNDLSDLRDHPQAHFQTIETSAGQLLILAPPYARAPRRTGPPRVPEVGENTEQVRAEFGFATV